MTSKMPYEDDDHATQDMALQTMLTSFTSYNGPFMYSAVGPAIDDTGGDWHGSTGPGFSQQFGTDFFGLMHVTTTAAISQLEDTSHQANGTAWFGSGNSTA